MSPEKVVHISPMRATVAEVPQLEGRATFERLVIETPLRGQTTPMEPEFHEAQLDLT